MPERPHGFTQQGTRRIVDAVRGFEYQSRGRNVGGQNVSKPDTGWLQFKNDSSEEAPANAVMRVKTDIETDSGNPPTIILKCTKPDATFSRRYAVNSGTPVPAGQYGLCRLFGENIEVAYDSGTPAADEGWGPKPGQWTLSKQYPQTALVAGIVNSTDKILLAQWGPITGGIGKANGTIANRASGAFSVWAGAMGSEVDITSMDPSGFNLGPEVVSGDWITWTYLNGQISLIKLCA